MSPRLARYGLLAVGLIAAAASLGYPLTGNDSPSYAIIGQTILEGGMPYRDAWDVKGPGIYFANAVCLLLVGKSALAFRLFDVVWQLLTAWLAGAIAWRIYRRESARLVTALSYLLFYYSQNFWSWLQSDSYSSLPLAAGFLAMLVAMENDRPAHWILAGAGVGVATLFKFPLGGVGIPMILVACLHGGFAAPRAVRRLASLAAGFLIPVVACGLYLYWGGALGDYLEAQFRYAPQYVQITRDNIAFACLKHRLTLPVLLPLYAGLLLAAVGLVVRWRDGERPRVVEVSLLLWAALVYVMVWVQSVFFVYHYLPMVIPVAALAAGSLAPLFEARRAQSLLWRYGLPLFLLLMFVVPVKKIGEHALDSVRTFRGGYEKDIWLDTGRDLKQRTAPQDRIFVWGNAASIYLHAERKHASRFLAVYPLSSYLKGLSYRDKLITDLRASRPVYLLMMKSFDRDFACSYPIDEDAFLASFPALVNFIQSEYTLESEDSRYRLYRRNAQ